MPGGIGIRPAGGRLDLELGAGSRLRRLEAICRLQGPNGVQEISAGRWHGSGGTWSAACGPIELRLQAHPSAAAGVEVRLEAIAREDATIKLIGVRAQPLPGGGPAERMAESGYQAWDDASVWEPAEAPGARSSWWTCGLGGAAGTGALGFAARSARTHATRFDWDGACAVTIAHVASPGPAAEVPVWRPRPGSRFRGEPVVVVAGDSLQSALQAAADPKARPERPAPRGWLSWYQHGAWISREEVAASAARLREAPYRDLGLDVVQIDDGWQMTYGDWVPNTKFGDLGGLCSELREAGQTPGIWTAPFLASVSSDLCDEAPEAWFVQDRNTREPLIDPRHVVFGPMRVLDARRPGVLDHFERVFRRLREHGFRYFKIDFLYAGAYAGLPALRAGIRAIRRGAGRDAYLLACGAPLLPVAGLVDGCRIGPDTCTPFYDFDTGESSPTFFGDEVQAVARAVALRRQFGSWYDIDPDVAVAGGLDAGRVRQLTTIVALAGGLYFLSDALRKLPADRAALLANPEIVALASGPPARPDLATATARRPPGIWTRDDGVVALFNWTGESIHHQLQRSARDLWAASDIAAGEIEVPANDVRVLRLGEGRL
jgi:alpha-galactosidase